MLSKVRPRSVSITVLLFSVASVNGLAVEARTDSSPPKTGSSALSVAPLYPAIAPAFTVKVSVVAVLMLPLKSSFTVTAVSLTRFTLYDGAVTPAIPDTLRSRAMSFREVSKTRPPCSVSVTMFPSNVVSVNGLAAEATTYSSEAGTGSVAVSAGPL